MLIGALVEEVAYEDHLWCILVAAQPLMECCNAQNSIPLRPVICLMYHQLFWNLAEMFFDVFVENKSIESHTKGLGIFQCRNIGNLSDFCSFGGFETMYMGEKEAKTSKNISAKFQNSW